MLISEWIFVCMLNLFSPLIFFKIFCVILQGKQGIVRHIYQGIVFLCDGNEEENGGYVTAKAIT
jgi:hypothetical protein